MRRLSLIERIGFLPRINILILFHNYDKALELCNNYLKIAPGNSVFYEYAALIYKRKGYIKEAIETYKKALSLFPDVLADKIDLIELLYSIQKYDDVITYATEILTKNQKGFQEQIKAAFFDTLYWYLAFSYFAIEQYQKATEFFEKLRLTRYKNSADIYKSLGYCYHKLNRNKNAIDAYQIALRLGCDDANIASAINELKRDSV